MRPELFQVFYIKIDKKFRDIDEKQIIHIIEKIPEILETILHLIAFEVITIRIGYGIVCLVNFSKSNPNLIIKNLKSVYEENVRYFEPYGYFNLTIGVGYIVANSRNIMGFPDSFRWFGQGYLGTIPIPIIIMIVVALIGSFILNKTYFGRYVFALGGNEEAARLAGVNTDEMKVILFMICGFISGITSVLLLSRVFAGQVSTGQGLEFDCLTAVLLGGVSFTGSEGYVFGLITGIIIIGVLNNAMLLASFPDFSQNVVKGAVLLIAVGFDVYQKNRKTKEIVAKVAA